MFTRPGFWPGCPDREQTASVASALGQIKTETLNYPERLLQAVWIPKWFASLTHYDSSQAVLINVIGGFSDCIWCQRWHITCAQQLKLALFVHILISHILSHDRWAFYHLHIPLLPMYAGLMWYVNKLETCKYRRLNRVQTTNIESEFLIIYLLICLEDECSPISLLL